MFPNCLSCCIVCLTHSFNRIILPLHAHFLRTSSFQCHSFAFTISHILSHQLSPYHVFCPPSPSISKTPPPLFLSLFYMHSSPYLLISSLPPTLHTTLPFLAHFSFSLYWWSLGPMLATYQATPEESAPFVYLGHNCRPSKMLRYT